MKNYFNKVIDMVLTEGKDINAAIEKCCIQSKELFTQVFSDLYDFFESLEKKNDQHAIAAFFQIFHENEDNIILVITFFYPRIN